MKNQFLSTPSARRATERLDEGVGDVVISIHALREEGDSSAASPRASPAYFYPRPPRGGRPEVKKGVNIVFEFLSTPSARRATIAATARETIHGDFYPRPPRGGRRDFVGEHPGAGQFLSTPSARRATCKQ